MVKPRRREWPRRVSTGGFSLEVPLRTGTGSTPGLEGVEGGRGRAGVASLPAPFAAPGCGRSRDGKKMQDFPRESDLEIARSREWQCCPISNRAGRESRGGRRARPPHRRFQGRRLDIRSPARAMEQDFRFRRLPGLHRCRFRRRAGVRLPAIRILRAAFLLLLSVPLGGMSQTSPLDQPSPQILVLNSYHVGYFWTDTVVQGIRRIVTCPPAADMA